MTTEQNQSRSNQSKSVDNGLSAWQALGFAWELGYTMAIPLVLLALGGRLLDRYFETSPLFLLIGIILSIIASSILVGRKAVAIIKRAEDESKHSSFQ